MSPLRTALVVLLAASKCTLAPSDPLLSTVLAAVTEAANATMLATPSDRYPGYGNPDGAPGWRFTTYAAWSAGFLPSMLWLLYNASLRSNDSSSEWWLAQATARTAPLAPGALINTTHDLGFMVYLPFGAQYALTHNTTARDVALRAAATLATRFIPAVGAIRSWGQPGPDHAAQVIIDNMMNLELLFWAGAESGNATYTAMAVSHCAVTARDFFQPWTAAQGCCWHLAVYDDRTGALLSRTSERGGLGPDTVWSQGQAWAIAGYAIAYRYTRNASFLSVGLAAAECYMAATEACCGGNSDRVFAPLWDFNATASSGLQVDTSAATIAAAGLIELAWYAPPASRARLLSFANATLNGVLGAWRFVAGSNDAVLRNGSLEADVGVALIYGDYYLLQAAMRWDATPEEWRAEAAAVQ